MKGAKAGGAALGIFLLCWVLIALLNVAFVAVAGRRPTWTQNEVVLFALAILILVPLAFVRGGLEALKPVVRFGVPAPENAAGGLAVGLAAVLWPTLSFAGRGGGLPVVLAPLLAMFLGGTLAARFVKKDRSRLLVLLSPLVSVAAFVVFAAVMHYQP